MKDLPLVSIVTPCYNSKETIAETIESILEQTYSNIEYIIVDDGSSDNVEEVILPYVEKYGIKFIQKKNGGVSSARNLGADNACGSFIMFVDSDDKIKNTYVEKCINKYKKDPDLSMVCTYVQEFERSTNKIRHEKFNFEDFIFHNSLFPSIIMFKTEEFRKYGPYDENMKVCEDWNLCISIARNNPKVSVIPEYLYLYRKRKNESSLTDLMSRQKATVEKAYQQIYENHKDLYDIRFSTPLYIVYNNLRMLKRAKVALKINSILSSFFYAIVIYFLIRDLDINLIDSIVFLSVTMLIVFQLFFFSRTLKKLNTFKT